MFCIIVDASWLLDCCLRTLIRNVVQLVLHVSELMHRWIWSNAYFRIRYGIIIYAIIFVGVGIYACEGKYELEIYFCENMYYDVT